MKIRKRDGKVVSFERAKIETVLDKAAANFPDLTVGELTSIKENVVSAVVEEAQARQDENDLFTVEDCQDIIVSTLRKLKYRKIANHYQKVREEKAVDRELRAVFDIVSNEETDEKTDNANVDGYTMSGRHLHISEDVLKIHSAKHVFSKKVIQAVNDGIIYIHDRGWASIGSLTCNQIDIPKLFKGGFSTGHGYLREPGSIRTAFALSAIAIQSSQNDYHGGQSIPHYDYSLAPYVLKSFRKYIVDQLKYVNTYLHKNITSLDEITALIKNPGYITDFDRDHAINKLKGNFELEEWPDIVDRAIELTRDETYQGAESLIHNLNTMHSRAGAQVPFSSINLGMDTSNAGRLVTEMMLKAQMAGLGKHETPLFPIQIFILKKGVNFNPGDPNYDLFRLAMKCSSERLFPTYTFVDSSFNLPFYERDHYYGCIQTMGQISRDSEIDVKIDGVEMHMTIEDFYNYLREDFNKRYGYVYQLTDTETGEFYIGQHKCNDTSFEEYDGSSSQFNFSDKHLVEKEVLAYADTQEDLDRMEDLLIRFNEGRSSNINPGTSHTFQYHKDYCYKCREITNHLGNSCQKCANRAKSVLKPCIKCGQERKIQSKKGLCQTCLCEETTYMAYCPICEKETRHTKIKGTCRSCSARRGTKVRKCPVCNEFKSFKGSLCPSCTGKLQYHEGDCVVHGKNTTFRNGKCIKCTNSGVFGGVK